MGRQTFRSTDMYWIILTIITNVVIFACINTIGWYFFIIFEYILHISMPTLWYFVFLYLIFLSQQVLYFLPSTLVLTLYIDVVLSLSIGLLSRPYKISLYMEIATTWHNGVFRVWVEFGTFRTFRVELSRRYQAFKIISKWNSCRYYNLTPLYKMRYGITSSQNFACMSYSILSLIRHFYLFQVLTKWTTIRRRHCPMHFIEGKY